MKLKTVSTIFKVVEIVLCSIGFICCVIPNNNTAAMTGIVFFIFAIIVAIAYLVFRISPSGVKMGYENHKEELKQKRERENYYSYKDGMFGGNTLIIHKRSPRVREAIKIEKEREAYLIETPDKLIYTGATVGGITTGGFHVQKGGVSAVSGKKTGRVNLIYKFENKKIYFVELSDSDFKKLKHTDFDILIAKEKDKAWFNLKGKNLIDVHSLFPAKANKLIDWLCDVEKETDFANYSSEEKMDYYQKLLNSGKISKEEYEKMREILSEE